MLIHYPLHPISLHLRTATIADANDLVRLHFAAVHGTASATYAAEVLQCWAPAPDDEQRQLATRQAIQRGDELFIVAEIDGILCGFGSIVPASSELRAVYVDPVYGRRGIGSAILHRLEELALQRGCTQLQMDASINAEAFYARHGYTIVRRGVHRLAGGAEMPCVTMNKGITLAATDRPRR